MVAVLNAILCFQGFLSRVLLMDLLFHIQPTNGIKVSAIKIISEIHEILCLKIKKIIIEDNESVVTL
jgi:hypothetical protein